MVDRTHDKGCFNTIPRDIMLVGRQYAAWPLSADRGGRSAVALWRLTSRRNSKL